MRMDVPDGAPVTICEVTDRSGHYISWGADGNLLFAAVQGEVIYRVHERDGRPEAVVRADTTGTTRVLFPHWLPDGRSFLYLSRGVHVASLLMRVNADGSSDTVMSAHSYAQYAEPGVLAYVRNGSLLGQRYDWRSGRISGSPFAIADSVRFFLSTGAAAFATSAGGTLSFQTGMDRERLAWFDRGGRETASVGPVGSFFMFSLADDGNQLLLDYEDPHTGAWDVWLVDLERGVHRPLASSPQTEVYGTWMPGQDVALYSLGREGGPPHLTRHDLKTGDVSSLLSSGGLQQPSDVSRDGRFLLFSQRSSEGSFDILSLALDADPAPQFLVRTPGDDRLARFSPDARYVAYVSDETGTNELYLIPFNGPGSRVRVSPDGALIVQWSHATNELIYLAPDQRVIAVTVHTDPLHIEAPRTLFTLPEGIAWTHFDLSPDGQRILASISVDVANERPIAVITNWTARAEGSPRRN
jgi:dipeptidyl aminopeptidase/acylaminoacyl peptidase